MYTHLLSWVFWVLFSITLHELAHGWAALWQGDDTPRRLDRMTWNPIVHMGGWSLLMFAVIGIAWGVMPTDPGKYRWRRKGRIVVSGAGPLMNIVLAFICLTALILWLAVGPHSPSSNLGSNLGSNLAIFLWTGGWLNILLALFNLLPIPPLDGSGILSGLSFKMYQWMQNPQVQLGGLVVVLIIFYTGIGGIVFTGSQLVGLIYVDAVGALLGSPPLFDVIA